MSADIPNPKLLAFVNDLAEFVTGFYLKETQTPEHPGMTPDGTAVHAADFQAEPHARRSNAIRIAPAYLADFIAGGRTRRPADD